MYTMNAASGRKRRPRHPSPRLLLAALAILSCLPSHPSATAAEAAPKPAGPPVPKLLTNNVAPLAAEVKAVATHGPYADGDCSLCHQSKDREKPGPLKMGVTELCLDCHEEFQKVLGRKSSHVAAKESCVNCHNPHNSKLPKLLVEDASNLCQSCHQSIKALATTAKVKHDAVTMEAKCLNCHNPHGANVEHLLTKLAYDLCVNCHGKDEVTDHDGKRLTNMKALLAANPEQHGPVASKDCTACHNPHGGESFRLLTKEYPPQFYSGYDPKLYALCFDCHEESMLAQANTTTLTQFRNGDKNLHFVHVNKEDRGRTCRACHEVHAAKQKHQIRDAVPYGSKGWLLKINYTKTPEGGSCEKTCHETRSYTNTSVKIPPSSAKN
jgi:predicted CXXCH cytochrome family protein